MATVTEAPVERAGLEPAQRFVLHDVSWQSYRQTQAALGRRHLRFTFDRGTLEFMTKSLLHGRLSRFMVRLLVILAEELQLPLDSCGDMTVEREDLDRAAEPDECFYITHAAQMRDRDRVDLAVDPPPDLAVEIDVTSSSQRRLGVYAAVRVPEVWLCSEQSVTILRLTGEGDYAPAEHSLYAPFVTAALLTQFLRQRQGGDENELCRAFREWVRHHIRSGAAQPETPRGE